MAASQENLTYWTDRLQKQLEDLGLPKREDMEDAFRHIPEEADGGLYGLTCFFAACMEFSSNQQQLALQYLAEAIRCMTGTPQEKHVSRCYNILGIMAHGQNNLILAMEHYDVALEYCEKYPDSQNHSIIVSNMADAYFRMGSYSKAIEFYNNCIREFGAAKNQNARADYNYQMMLAGYGYCLVMAEYIDLAEETARKLWDMIHDPKRRAIPKLAAYTFFALLSFRQGNIKAADWYLDIAIDDVNSSPKTISEFDNLLDLAQLLLLMERFQRLQELVESVEKQIAVENNEGFLLQLFLLRLQYCTEQMPEDDYIKYSRMFFELKEKYEYNENMQVMQMMTLRNRLKDVQQEQEILKKQNSTLLYRSQHDQVTGLPNRRLLNRFLEKAFVEMDRKQQNLGIMFIDIDYFKELNDRYGHYKGDCCIAAVAESISSAARDDFAARYGGDEFVVVLKDRSEEYVYHLGEMILHNVKACQIPNVDSQVDNVVSVTIGVVNAVPWKYNRVWDYMMVADDTLYQQKEARKGCLRYRSKIGEEG